MSFWNSGRALDAHSIFGFSVSLTPAATAAASSVEQAFTVSPPQGAKLKSSDLVLVSGPASGNNVSIGNCRVNATGQLVITFVNPSAGSLTHAAGSFSVLIARL